MSDETATAMSDVFTSYSEDLDRRFAEMSGKINLLTTVMAVGFTVLALIIAAGAASITVAIALKGG